MTPIGKEGPENDMRSPLHRSLILQGAGRRSQGIADSSRKEFGNLGFDLLIFDYKEARKPGKTEAPAEFTGKCSIGSCEHVLGSRLDIGQLVNVGGKRKRKCCS